jgi:hypothetical protein
VALMRPEKLLIGRLCVPPLRFAVLNMFHFLQQRQFFYSEAYP